MRPILETVRQIMRFRPRMEVSSQIGVLGALMMAAGLGCVQNASIYRPLNMPPSMEWMKVKWTASDSKFLQIKGRLEKEVNSAAAAIPRAERFRANLKQKNPLVAYEYAWLALKARQAYERSWERRQMIQEAVMAMEAAGGADSAEYARLKFCIDHVAWPRVELAQVVPRLLEKFPADPELLCRSAVVLSYQGQAVRTKRSFELLKKAKAIDPNSYAVILTTAELYVSQAMDSRTAMNKPRALQELAVALRDKRTIGPTRTALEERRKIVEQLPVK